MPQKITDSPSLLEVCTDVRRQKLKNHFLRRINACVDWLPIRTLINKKYTKTQNAVGNPAYDGLMLFKILLLEQWYGLSDYQVEERINDSISFCEFLGLDMGLPAPDHSTICRFRLALTELNLMDKLLEKLNRQLDKQGVLRIREGVIVDASIVESPYEPTGRGQLEIADDREDLRSQESKDAEESYHNRLKSTNPGVDSEGRWTKKSGKYWFGFKKHVVTDEQGLVMAVITTPANQADTTQLRQLVDRLDLPQGTLVFADKGYSSKANSDYLDSRGLADGILFKASRNRPLSAAQRLFNKLASSFRYPIERTFGSIRRWFLGGRCRYKGLARTHTQMVLEAVAYNLKRMPNLVVPAMAN